MDAIYNASFTQNASNITGPDTSALLFESLVRIIIPTIFGLIDRLPRTSGKPSRHHCRVLVQTNAEHNQHSYRQSGIRRSVLYNFLCAFHGYFICIAYLAVR